MRSFLSLTLIILSSVLAFGAAESTIDSLKKVSRSKSGEDLAKLYYELSLELQIQNPDSALIYANRSELLLLEDDPGSILPFLYKSKGIIYIKKGAMERSLLYFKKAYDEFIKLENNQELGECALQLGNLFYDIANFSEAYYYFIQSLHAYEQENDRLGIARMQNNLGIVSHDMGRVTDAEQHYRTAYTIYLDNEYYTEACGALSNIGLVYYERELYDSALNSFFEVMDILLPDTLPSYTETYILAGTYNNMALIYSETGRYEEAKESFRNGLKLAIRIDHSLLEGSVYVNLGSLYREQQELDSALYYLHRALRISNKRDYRSLELDAYAELAKLHARPGSYASAYNWQVKYDTLYKSLFNEDQSDQIARLRTRYEQELKEKEIQQLQSETHVQHVINLISLALLFLVIVLIIIITVNLSRNKRTNKMLAERNLQISNTLHKLSESELELQKLNRSKDRIFSVVAHDLRNPVAAVTGFSELLYDNYDQFEDEIRKEYLAQILQGTQRIQNMLENLLIWARSQMKAVKFEPEMLKVKALVEDCIKESKANLDHKKVECKSKISPRCIVYADKSMLHTVIRNLLSNAIKFSFPGGVIIISSKVKDHACAITISDNGIGIQPEIQEKLFAGEEVLSTPGTTGESGSGLGLVICKEFLDKNQGSLVVESEPGNGSNFTILLPSREEPT